MILSNLSLFVFALLQETAPEGEVPQDPPSLWMPLLMVAAIFWFIVVNPERKKRKEREGMVTALKKGDKVMTTTGMYATIAQVQGDVVTLQVADGVRIKFALAAVQGLVDPEAKKEETAKEDSQKGEDKSEKQLKETAESKDD